MAARGTRGAHSGSDAPPRGRAGAPPARSIAVTASTTAVEELRSALRPRRVVEIRRPRQAALGEAHRVAPRQRRSADQQLLLATCRPGSGQTAKPRAAIAASSVDLPPPEHPESTREGAEEQADVVVHRHARRPGGGDGRVRARIEVRDAGRGHEQRDALPGLGLGEVADVDRPRPRPSRARARRRPRRHGLRAAGPQSPRRGEARPPEPEHRHRPSLDALHRDHSCPPLPAAPPRPGRGAASLTPVARQPASRDGRRPSALPAPLSPGRIARPVAAPAPRGDQRLGPRSPIVEEARARRGRGRPGEGAELAPPPSSASSAPQALVLGISTPAALPLQRGLPARVAAHRPCRAPRPGRDVVPPGSGLSAP